MLLALLVALQNVLVVCRGPHCGSHLEFAHPAADCQRAEPVAAAGRSQSGDAGHAGSHCCPAARPIATPEHQPGMPPFAVASDHGCIDTPLAIGLGPLPRRDQVADQAGPAIVAIAPPATSAMAAPLAAVDRAWRPPPAGPPPRSRALTDRSVVELLV